MGPRLHCSLVALTLPVELPRQPGPSCTAPAALQLHRPGSLAPSCAALVVWPQSGRLGSLAPVVPSRQPCLSVGPRRLALPSGPGSSALPSGCFGCSLPGCAAPRLCFLAARPLLNCAAIPATLRLPACVPLFPIVIYGWNRSGAWGCFGALCYHSLQILRGAAEARPPFVTEGESYLCE